MENPRKNRPEYTIEVKKIFATKLKEARQEQSITQKELGELLALDNKDISSLETNRRNPSLDELRKLCDLLNKTESYFFPNGTPELKKKFIPNPRNNKRNNNNRFKNEKVGKYGQPKMSKEELNEIHNQVVQDGIVYDVEDELEKKSQDSIATKNEEALDVVNEVEVVQPPVVSQEHVIKRKITITLPNSINQNVAEGISITVEEEVVKK